VFPPRRILAAVDFSDSSRVALNAAGRLASQCGAELSVLYALDPLLAQAAQVAGVELARETDAELTRFVHTAVRRPARQLVVTGAAAHVITLIAERERADVIVLGAHGMSGVTHAVFGSTTERVLRRSPISVFVVPDDWTAPAPAGEDLSAVGPVVAGVDLHCGSAAAAAAASELAHVLGTRLEVMHVVSPIAAPLPWRPHADRAAAEATSRAERELALLVRGLRPDVSTTARVVIGDVAQHLANAVAPHGLRRPVLVLGRNPERAHGTFPGTTAYRVLLESSAPVLVYLPAD
jgi:nucleotide-binding universal stress UspA family protein